MKDRGPALPFVHIGPSLRHVIVIIECDDETRVVPVVRCLHTRNSLERKGQPLAQIDRGAAHQLGLVAGAAVVRRDQMITVHGHHRDHRWLVGWLRFH